jgi:asparagine synthase (glutamine-hydrolysing)
LLARFATQGEAILPLLQGIFAFVIWHKLARHAFAARRPYGIKPLYLAHTAFGVGLGS